MPALDLALSPEMIESATEMILALLFEPLGEVAGDLRRTIVADELGFVVDLGLPVTMADVDVVLQETWDDVFGRQGKA